MRVSWLVAVLCGPLLLLQAGEDEVSLQGNIARTDDGKQFIEVKSKAEPLDLPPNVIQLVSAPDGKVVYGIFKLNAGIKIFEPPSFKEIDEIPVPHDPDSIWCDEKRIVVTCSESQVVTILDAEKRKAIKSVMLKDLTPIRVMGHDSGEGFLTLWSGLDAHKSGLSVLYSVKENGDVKRVSDFSNIRGDWSIPTHRGTHLLVQYSGGYPEGVPRLIEVATGKELKDNALFGANGRFRSQDFGRCFQTSDGHIVLPTKKGNITWSYATTNDLQSVVFDFPGVAIAEAPQENLLISWSFTLVPTNTNSFSMGPAQVYYINRLSGQLMRRIEIVNFTGVPSMSLCKTEAAPTVIFIPGHELLVSIKNPHDGQGDAKVIRCGPVKNAPSVKCVTVSNTPPATVQVGKELSFTPVFTKTGGERVTFKIKKPLDGMKIDPEKGTLTWTPADAYVGRYDIQIMANLDGQEMPVLTWTLEIQP
jgi:hypothetical protein